MTLSLALRDLCKNSDHMPVDVFVGGNGDIVLVQEIADLAGEHYVRIAVPINQVMKLCESIHIEYLKAKSV